MQGYSFEIIATDITVGPINIGGASKHLCVQLLDPDGRVIASVHAGPDTSDLGRFANVDGAGFLSALFGDETAMVANMGGGKYSTGPQGCSADRPL